MVTIKKVSRYIIDFDFINDYDSINDYDPINRNKLNNLQVSINNGFRLHC